jgi:hypothetical protein
MEDLEQLNSFLSDTPLRRIMRIYNDNKQYKKYLGVLCSRSESSIHLHVVESNIYNSFDVISFYCRQNDVFIYGYAMSLDIKVDLSCACGVLVYTKYLRDIYYTQDINRDLSKFVTDNYGLISSEV